MQRSAAWIPVGSRRTSVCGPGKTQHRTLVSPHIGNRGSRMICAGVSGDVPVSRVSRRILRTISAADGSISVHSRLLL